MKRTLNEGLVVILITFSLLTLILGFLFSGLNNLYGDQWLGVTGVICWMLCAVPLVSLQFFMTAGIYVSIISKFPVIVKLAIYFVVIPIANLWFLIWLGALVPAIFDQGFVDQSSLEACAKALLTQATILSVIINGAGLLVRLFISKRKKVIA